MFGILCLASLDPNPGVSELRPQGFWLFRIQAYVLLGIFAHCTAPGGALGILCLPLLGLPQRFSAETPWFGGCVRFSDTFLSGTVILLIIDEPWKVIARGVEARGEQPW